MANTVAIPLTYFFAYNTGHALNKKLQLFSRPRIYRAGFVGMVSIGVELSQCQILDFLGWLSCVYLVLYLFWFNYGNLEFDSAIFKDICKTKEEVDSGISYFNKLLKRNVILRRVIGEEMNYYIQVVGATAFDQSLQIKCCFSGVWRVCPLAPSVARCK